MKLSYINKNNMMICAIVILVIFLILWLAFKPYGTTSKTYKPCPNSKILVPIGNGQSVELTKEQYKKLIENYTNIGTGNKEGFYVSERDYIPNVKTENEYTPMLSLYKPKEQNRIIPEPAPVSETPGPVMPVPVPVVNDNKNMSMTGATGPVEGYGNIFLDNFEPQQVDPELNKYRQELTEMSPFFLNNGKIMNGVAI